MLKRNLNCRGKLIPLDSPKVMGILNVTPDSFYDGGRYNSSSQIISQVKTMVAEKVDLIDIGACSSRPNSVIVSEAEEKKRLFYTIQTIIDKFPDVILSVDTTRSEIAAKCIELGASIINDISAGKFDSNMLSTIAELQVPYILMHMRGNSNTMASLTNYNNVFQEVISEVSERISLAHELGINDIIVDPGFGFAKNINQNYELLNHLDILKSFLDKPMLVGLSRKSMIYKVLKGTPDTALFGSLALNTIALTKGADILRVHDVKETKNIITVLNHHKTINKQND